MGQFSRLDSEAAAEVVDVVVAALLAGLELHAARTTADAARADSTTTPLRRVRRHDGTVTGIGVAEERVTWWQAPFDGNCTT